MNPLLYHNSHFIDEEIKVDDLSFLSYQIKFIIESGLKFPQSSNYQLPSSFLKLPDFLSVHGFFYKINNIVHKPMSLGVKVYTS